METAILFILVLGLLFLGVPVAVSLGLSSIIVIAFFSDDSMSSVALQLFTASQNYTLLAIPFFVLASAFMSTGGVARRIIRFSIATVGHFRGGLAMASVLACMMFAALSGSSPATVVAIGTIAIAGMRQVGYSKEFAAGVIANAGTLGILIPPSIVMVVYAAATNVSVGRMFLAGVRARPAGRTDADDRHLCHRAPPQPAGRGLERLRRDPEGRQGSRLGPVPDHHHHRRYLWGRFTPTEAAAVAAVYAFFIALFIYRDMGPMRDRRWLGEEADRDSYTPARVGFSATVYALAFFFVWMVLSFFVTADWENVTASGRAWVGLAFALAIMVAYGLWRDPETSIANLPRNLVAGLPVWGRNLSMMGRHFLGTFMHEDTRKVMIDSSKTIIMLMFIIVNALLFAHVLTAERIPQTITDLMVDAGFTWFTFLIAVNILLLIGGQFMEPSGLLLIVAPVVFPIALELGVDPIHLGIIMVVNMEIGMITPPIGLNLFVTSGITGMSLIQVVRAAAPFVAVLLVFLVIVTYVPALSTALPYALMGPEIITNR